MPDPQAPLTALVVDDEAAIAEELADGLRLAGVPTLVAHSGQQAQAILAADPAIGAVVTDVDMPGGDGFSLARRILGETRPEHARRVVIMTGHSRLEHAAEAVRAGAFDYLRKPFELDEMVGAVVRALRSAGDQRRDHARRRTTVQRLADAEAATESLRLRDAVTGLPNNLALQSALESSSDARTALLMVRLGGLQFVTAAGSRDLHDGLLAAAAARFQQVAGGQAIFALREPAHIAVLAEDLDAAGAMKLGATLAEALAAPLVVEGQSAGLTAAVGVAHGAETCGATPMDACAQVAMAEAVRLGGSRVVAFSAALHGDALRRLRISQFLPRAASEGQVQLHYQPLRTPDLAQLRGYEALMRWTHPLLGQVRPDEFIAAAEETGAILDLGAWAAQAAARQAALWRRGGKPAPYVGVNVSGRQILEADVPGLFAELLAEHRLPADALVIEVTETVAVGDAACGVLESLRAMGLHVALDDFGAGFSSLGALRRLPADAVKFDRSLLPAGPRMAAEAHFYRNLVGAIRGLGFGVVAEGIETGEQLHLAASAGADVVQGYLVGRPAPPPDDTMLPGA